MAKIATDQKRGINVRTSERDAGRSQRPANPQDEIQKLAYKFFLDRGCQHGHDRADWLRAEAIVKGRRSS